MRGTSPTPWRRHPWYGARRSGGRAVAARSVAVWSGSASRLSPAPRGRGYLVRRPAASSILPDWSDIPVMTLTADPGYEGEPTFSRTAARSPTSPTATVTLRSTSSRSRAVPAINRTNDPGDDVQPAFCRTAASWRSCPAVREERPSSAPLRGSARGGGIWIMRRSAGLREGSWRRETFLPGRLMAPGSLRPRQRSATTHCTRARNGRGKP